MKDNKSSQLKAAVKILLGVLLICALIFAFKNGHRATTATAESSRNAPAKDLPVAAVPAQSQIQAVAINDSQLIQKGKPTDSGCFLATYHHKELPGHKTHKECALHKNYIHLSAVDANLKSVCVRLNGTPVSYEFVQEKKTKGVSGIMLGPIAGPDSKISVRYCLGIKKCADDCKIPQDEFMDAIGGTDKDADPRMPIVKWDPTDQTASDSDAVAELDSDLQKELSDADLSVFEGWIGNDEAVSCSKEHLAQKN